MDWAAEAGTGFRGSSRHPGAVWAPARGRKAGRVQEAAGRGTAQHVEGCAVGTQL